MSTFNTTFMIVHITITLNGGNGELTIPGIEVVETTEWFTDGGSSVVVEISQRSWEMLQAKYGLHTLMLWGWKNDARSHIMAFGRI